jgi:ABC-2 type transport system permease protein
LLLCVANGIAYTAFRVNHDVTDGMFTRFRAMPIARFALVGGHVLASIIVNAVSVTILIGASFLIGYRPSAGLTGWLLSGAVLVLALVAFSEVGVTFGLAAKTDEGSGMFAYLVMGLLFVSSGFAPTETMPGPLRAFADHQPMTTIVNTIRNAQLGLPDDGDALGAVLWLSGIIIAFAFFANLANRRLKLPT